MAPFRAYWSGVQRAQTRTPLAGGGWRDVQTLTTSDTDISDGVYGDVLSTNALGDTSTSADDTCTVNALTPNTATSLIRYDGGTAAPVSGVPLFDTDGYAHVFSGGDFSGDGPLDVLAVKTSDGSLWMWPGASGGGFGAAVSVNAACWNQFDTLLRPAIESRCHRAAKEFDRYIRSTTRSLRVRWRGSMTESISTKSRRYASIFVGALLGLTIVSCSRSPEESAGRDLAATLEIDSYRHVSTSHKGEVTIDYFVGPPDVDLVSTATAQDWRPEPAPADHPNSPGMDAIVLGTKPSGDLKCHIVISRLQSGLTPFSTKNLSNSEISDVEAGRLWWLEADTFCLPAKDS